MMKEVIVKSRFSQLRYQKGYTDTDEGTDTALAGCTAKILQLFFRNTTTMGSTGQYWSNNIRGGFIIKQGGTSKGCKEIR